jgi:hypothetical protein
MVMVCVLAIDVSITKAPVAAIIIVKQFPLYLGANIQCVLGVCFLALAMNAPVVKDVLVTLLDLA